MDSGRQEFTYDGCSNSVRETKSARTDSAYPRDEAARVYTECWHRMSIAVFHDVASLFRPCVAGLLILVFAIKGYKKAKRVGTERENIRYMILGGCMILESIFLVFLE